MYARLARVLTDRAGWVLVLLAAVTAAAAVLATQARFEFAPQALLRGDEQLIRDLESFKETFAYEDSVLMVVIEATGERDVIHADLLNWQADAAARIDAIPAVMQVAAVATMEVPRRTLGFPPNVTTRPVIPEFPADERDARRVRAIVDDSPMITGTLISEDRRTTVLLAFLAPELQRIEDLEVIVDQVEAVLREHPAPAGYRTSLSGLPYIRVDTVENLQSDQRRLLPIAAGMYVIALSLVFRRLGGTLLPLLAVGMGLTWTIGATVALGSSFNLVSNVLPVLLIVIGVSNCVHVIDDYSEQLRPAGGDRVEAARRMIRHMGRSCLLTLFTTAIGFACLTAARSDVLQQFGWQAALGMVCLYVTIIGTFGSALRYFRPSRRSAAGAPLGHIVATAGHVIDHHPKTTLAASTLLIGGAVWLGAGVPVNSYMIETYDEGHPTLRTLRLVEEDLSGLLPIEIQLEADDPEQLLDPDVYRRVAEFEAAALRLDGVLDARSYVDVLEAVSAGMPTRDEDDESEATPNGLPPADEDLERDIRRSLWVVRRVGDTLGYPAFMTEDGRRGRILIKVRDIGTRRLQVVIDELREQLARQFPEGGGVRVELTGDAYVNTLAMNRIIRDLFYSLLGASVIIFIAIALIFRSLRTGLIAAVPNLTPLAVTLGYMGLRGYDMNVGNVIVFTISLGIAVDDSIHFLFRFREEVKLTRRIDEAVDRAFEGTGRAIVVTSLLIVAGLSVLLLSDFVPTRRFAELTSITMIGALIGDLLLLPACLVLFWKREPT